MRGAVYGMTAGQLLVAMLNASAASSILAAGFLIASAILAVASKEGGDA